MRHTPGPWRYIKPDWKGMAYLFSKSTESTVATFFESPCNKSDCKLIAAAPELYEALRDLFEAVVIPEEISIEAGCKARIRARDILLKLRGEEGGENA